MEKEQLPAAIQIACDLVDEGMITKEEAVLRIEAKSLDQLLHPTFDKDSLKAARSNWRSITCIIQVLAAGKVVFHS